MNAARAEAPRDLPHLDVCAMQQAQRGVLGRKRPCGCGSGERYTHCHFDADREEVRDRPKMSAILERVAEPMGFHDCRTVNEAEGVILAAAMVWNASRLPLAEGYEALEPLVGMLAEADAPQAAVDLVGEMLEVAHGFPDDERIVTSTRVVDDRPRGWTILAASIDRR